MITEANILVEKHTLKSLFFNSTYKASDIQAEMKKYEGKLIIKEHSVIFNTIFCHFYLHFYYYGNSHRNATDVGNHKKDHKFIFWRKNSNLAIKKS